MSYKSDDISVIITTTGDRISELKIALNSVLNQTAAVGQIFLVWDQVTVSSPMSQFIQSFPNIKHLLTGVDHGGAARARNIGILNSHTKLIAILDDDDIWYPNKIAKQISALNEQGNKTVLCLSQTMLIDEEYRIIRKSGAKTSGVDIFDAKKFFSNLPLKSSKIYLPTSSMIFSKNLTSMVIFNEELKSFEDIQFILEASCKGTCFIINEPLVLTLIRRGKFVGLSHTGFDFESWTKWIHKSSLLDPRTKGNILLYFGTKRLLQAKDFGKALRWIILSIKLKPDFKTFSVTTFIFIVNIFRRFNGLSGKST